MYPDYDLVSVRTELISPELNPGISSQRAAGLPSLSQKIKRFHTFCTPGSVVLVLGHFLRTINSVLSLTTENRSNVLVLFSSKIYYISMKILSSDSPGSCKLEDGGGILQRSDKT